MLTSTPLSFQLQGVDRMKSPATESSADMFYKIEAIEKQVMDLKLSVLKNMTPSKQKVISLKGIFKGVNITEKDIAAAKKSPFSLDKGCRCSIQ